MDECLVLIERLRTKHENIPRYTVSAHFIFQFYMIARLDDVMNFRVQDLTQNPEYLGTLKSKMYWSKNVIDEGDALEQIIISANNPSFCPILVLAIHLGHSIAYILINEDSKMFWNKAKYCC